LFPVRFLDFFLAFSGRSLYPHWTGDAITPSVAYRLSGIHYQGPPARVSLAHARARQGKAGITLFILRAPLFKVGSLALPELTSTPNLDTHISKQVSTPAAFPL